MQKKPPPRTFAAFLAGMAGGAAIWLLSPYITGEAEPWDAFLYFESALFIAGLFTALVCPRRWWVSAIGIYIGQVIFILCTTKLAEAPLLPIGLIYAAVLHILAFSGAGLTFLVYLLWQRCRPG